MVRPTIAARRGWPALALAAPLALASGGPALAQPAPMAEALAAKCRGRIAGLQTCRPAAQATANWAIPAYAPEPEPAPDDTLARALDDAYRTAPALQADRYRLRSYDEDYALALAEMRPSATLTIDGGYSKTVPGRTTQATRFFATSPIITSNSATAEVVMTQPITTGGKAAADREAAMSEVGAGRAQLRASEGDLLLAVIGAYAHVRRDDANLRAYAASVRQLEATLAEVEARRIAGELTRTDIGLARSQLELTRSQYALVAQQRAIDRADFARQVGRNPGELGRPPLLPGLPASLDAAFAAADAANPDLALATANEHTSRALVASARAAGRPTLQLEGSAALTGQAVPFAAVNEDQTFAGRAVLTVPLMTGGRQSARVAQAEDRNAVDRIGIEAARRQVAEGLVNAWNALATAKINIDTLNAQVAAARIYDEGTFHEYRAGLRSTFDVLYAHVTLRDAEVRLQGAECDLYVAAATLLRQAGLLELRSLTTGTGLYDPDAAFGRSARRQRLPWDPAFEAVDNIARPQARQKGLEQPPEGHAPPAMAPAAAGYPAAALETTPPAVPLPGTTGVPTPAPQRLVK